MTPTCPLVSVALIVYNHASYLQEALEGVLRQDYLEHMEIVVGNDGSDDGSDAILGRYSREYPGLVRLLDSSTRLGMHLNFRRTMASCRGTYIALLEGDDFWTDKGKISRQVGLLESDPTASLCFHPVVRRNDSNSASSLLVPPGQQEAYTLADICKNNIVPTCSVLFRADRLRDIPLWVDSLDMVDWPLMFLLAHTGRLRYMPEVMAVYRVHSGGCWSQLEPAVDAARRIKALTAFLEHTSEMYHPVIRERRAELHYLAASALLSDNELASACQHARHGWGDRMHMTPRYRKLYRGLVLTLFLSRHVPILMHVLQKARSTRRSSQ